MTCFVRKLESWNLEVSPRRKRLKKLVREITKAKLESLSLEFVSAERVDVAAACLRFGGETEPSWYELWGFWDYR